MHDINHEVHLYGTAKYGSMLNKSHVPCADEINTTYILNQVDLALNGEPVTFYSLFELKKTHVLRCCRVLFLKGTAVFSLMSGLAINSSRLARNLVP